MLHKQDIQIGEKLRELRKQQGVTIHALSQQTGLTSSFISQFERGRTKASVASITKITEALGLTMADVFEEQEHPEPKKAPKMKHSIPYLVRKADRPKVSFSVALDELNYDYLLSHPTNPLQVHLAVIQPGDTGTKRQLQADSSEEFILVLDGEFEIQVEENTYTLHAGDSLSFDGTQIRTWKNVHTSETRILWMIYK